MKKLLFISIFLISILALSQVVVPLKDMLKSNSAKNSLNNYLDEKKWDELFPNRNGLNSKNTLIAGKDFYSFKSFKTAAGLFPEFLKGDTKTQKRELAAFLANIAQETSGGWADAPGGYFKWGLYFLDEQQDGLIKNYADYSKDEYPPVYGVKYFGRGPKQLSWNYNYGQFSEAWFGSKDVLLLHPELLSQDPVLAFASAIWFWMTPQYPKPSCHNIMTGVWQPTKNDLLSGRLPGFGATVNVINGGVECGKSVTLQKTSYRYEYYNYFCQYFKVSPGTNIECSNQKPFGT